MRKSNRPAGREAECCESTGPVGANHTKNKHRVRRIRGQLDGVERMIDERRYCPDIITQIQAVRSALSSLEASILEEHLERCVRDAFRSGTERDQRAKVEEILEMVRRS